jgi:hypothetical protein
MHACTGMHGPAYMHTATYSWCCVNEPPVYACCCCCCCVHACVRGCACLCDRHRVSAEFFYSSAQAQQAWRIEFSYRNIDVFWKSSRHLSIGRARDAASRATRGFPKHVDICIRNHVWTKCTFGSVLYLIPLLIDGFRHGNPWLE